ncbi:hypothetical protein RJT34_32505 [Clitoria ternatea]|uniref:Uncharacterized protein n=1 Tax=Clitoria ternatea TaxID=43366 RepID=A0AAN9I3U5_CLITE
MASMPCQISILNKEKYSSNTLQILYGVHTARASNAAKVHDSAQARYPAKECNSVQACYSVKECNLAKIVTPPSHRLNSGGILNFPHCVASPYSQPRHEIDSVLRASENDCRYHPQSGQGNKDPVRRTVTPPRVYCTPPQHTKTLRTGLGLEFIASHMHIIVVAK